MERKPLFHHDREAAPHPLRASAGLAALVDALEQRNKIHESHAGILTALQLHGRELLLLQDFEHGVYMRAAYFLTHAAQDEPSPLVEIPLYLDAHLNCYPLALRGSAVGRMAHVQEQTSIVAFADHWAGALQQQGWSEHGMPCDLDRLSTYLAHDGSFTPTERARLAGWLKDRPCEAVDGCSVTLHGRCRHGAPSWFVALGLV